VRHWINLHLGYRLVFRGGVIAAGCQQTKEVRLSRSIPAENGNAVTVPSLEVEGPDESGEFELLTSQSLLARPASM